MTPSTKGFWSSVPCQPCPLPARIYFVNINLSTNSLAYKYFNKIFMYYTIFCYKYNDNVKFGIRVVHEKRLAKAVIYYAVLQFNIAHDDVFKF